MTVFDKPAGDLLGQSDIIDLTADAIASVSRSNAYNAFGEVLSTNLDGQEIEKHEYDGLGRIWRSKGADGVVRVFLHDVHGNVTTELRSANTSRLLENPAYKSAQDVVADNLVANDAANGIIRTETRYDLLGRTTVQVGTARTVNQFAGEQPVMDALNVRPTSVQRMDRWGNVIEVTDPRNAQWSIKYTYNDQNQRTSEANIAEGTTLMSRQAYYDALGRMIGSADGNGHVSMSVYDRDGNVGKEIRADGGVVEYDYNLFGNREHMRVYRSVNEYVASSYTYDHLGQMKTASGGTATYYTIADPTGGGGMHVALDSASVITDSFTYDELGRRIAVFDGLSNANYTRFDFNGNVTGTINALSYVTRHAFDKFNHKVAQQNADGKSMTWVVDKYGRAQSHTDLGQAVVSYGYDNLGRLTSQTSTARVIDTDAGEPQTIAGQNLVYTYDGDQLVKVEDKSDMAKVKVSTYAYDLAGRRIREKTVATGVVVQDNTITYDGAGRIDQVKDAYFDVDFSYDTNGNRTEVRTKFLENGVVTRDELAVNRYDRMNRQTVVNGKLVNGEAVLSRGGHLIEYDLAGNRTRDQYYLNVTDSTPVDERYRYNAAGQLEHIDRVDVGTQNSLYAVESRKYDRAGRVIHTTYYVDDMQRAVYYDANGNVLRMKMRTVNGGTLDDIYYSAFPDRSEYENSQVGYDEVGNARGYYLVPNQNRTQTQYTFRYALFDDYKESRSFASTGASVSNTESLFDANGHVVGVTVTKADHSVSNRTLVNDHEGRVLLKSEGAYVTRSLIVNGEVIGTSSTNPNDVPEAFGSTYQGVTSGALSAAPTLYTVQAGDTLRGIAAQAWGDAQLWYLIADANGISDANALQAGSVLRLPSRVNTVHNDFATFKPYDAAAAVGSTEAVLPVPGKADNCGVAGQLIMVVVAVAVTVASQGTLGLQAANFIMGTNAATVSALTTGGAIINGAVSAALGSIASQAVGVAIGAQDKFSWKGVALAAVGGGVSGGLAPSGADKAFMGISNETAAGMARAAVGNAMTQGIGVVTGLQPKFSWRGVAAAAAGSAGGQWANDKLSGLFSSGMPGRALAISAGSSFAAGLAASVAGGGKINVTQVAADAFGNALGNSIAEQMQPVQGENELKIGRKILTGAERLAIGGSGTSFAGFSADYLATVSARESEDARAALMDSLKDPYLLTAALGSGASGKVAKPMDLVKRANEISYRPQGAKIDANDLKSVYAQLRGVQADRNTTEEARAYVTSAIRSIHQRGVTENILGVEVTEQMLSDGLGAPGGGGFKIANRQAPYILPRTSSAVARPTVGVPATKSDNPLSPVQGKDIHGNEIMYRSMSKEQYLIFMETGKLPATTETSISPLLAYSSGYDGVTMKITTAPGTSAQLQKIGIAANKPAEAQFPDMSNRTGSWMQTNARFKVEGGQMTTQLGQGTALNIFNRNIVQFTQVSKQGGN